MHTTRALDSFVQRTREDSREGEILRRRIAAIGAVTLGLGGFMIAIGLTVVVVGFLAAVVVAVGVAAFLAAWPTLRGFALARVVPLGRDIRRAVLRAFAGTHRRGASAATATARSSTQAGRAFVQSVRAQLARRVAPRDPTREAMRLNAIGTQHRREGRYDEAIECHRRALEILRAVDERRGVALTQSNLALALSHAGDDGWAIGLLEEAAATLHDLGDEEFEARIMANLGIAHRRHGREQEGADVLELALSKLSPASDAYEAIEAELKRAS